MPEVRRDPLTGRRIILAPERSGRPIQVDRARSLVIEGSDPFAEGNEFETTPEVLAYRAPGSLPNGPGWRLRIVSNKYPALQESGSCELPGIGLYESCDAVGIHDVIIECPGRETSLARLSLAQNYAVLSAYRDRLVSLRDDPRLEYAVIFKNHGARAGASLAHSHSQLMALTFVPDVIAAARVRAQRYAEQHGHSLFDAIVEQELAAGARVVLETGQFLVFCPYASRFAFETWILPRQPAVHFAGSTPSQLAELATLLRSTLRALDLALRDPPYNFMLQTAPLKGADPVQDRWRLEICPRMSGVAGFEWATDCFVNTVLPETAAARLRAAYVSGQEADSIDC